MFIYTNYNTIVNTDNVTCFERVRKYTGSVVRDEVNFEIIAHVVSWFEDEARILIGEYSTDEEAQEMLDRIFNYVGAGLNFMDLRKNGGRQMNITAEQARLYAQGWKEAKEIIQEIEKQVEAVAKHGEMACIVPVNVMITLAAVELISEDLKKAGFSATFVRRYPQCEAFFKIRWSDTPEKDETQEYDIQEDDALEGYDNG